MSRRLNPGPPLTAEEEFCEHAPPTGGETFKAMGTALLITLGGALGWFLVVLATRRLWGFSTVLIGVAAGWTMHQAAGRHRSRTLGILAAVTTVLAPIIGYGMLWLPFVSPDLADRHFSWYDLAMLALGAFVAYRLAGPKAKTGEPPQ